MSRIILILLKLIVYFLGIILIPFFRKSFADAEASPQAENCTPKFPENLSETGYPHAILLDIQDLIIQVQKPEQLK